jgi:serine/threonine protein kinase
MKKPERIGPYTLLAPLGKRAPTRTWSAQAADERTRLAIKLARPKDLDGRARILHEVDIAMGFDHPNIIRLYECGEANGIMWLTCEYAAGPHKPLKLANFRQLLLALVHVHANGVVHGNLKPSNLLLDGEGTLRLSNFTNARREGELPAPASGQGRPHFMSPEQLQGLALDHRSDLFSAGAVLYLILTGKVPFEGHATRVLNQVMEDAPPPVAPSVVAPGLGTSFDVLMRRALAPAKSERFIGAFEFLSAFDVACKRGVRPPQ